MPRVVHSGGTYPGCDAEGFPRAPVPPSVNWPTVRLGEDQVKVLPFAAGMQALLALGLPMVSQRVNELGSQRDRSVASV